MSGVLSEASLGERLLFKKSSNKSNHVKARDLSRRLVFFVGRMNIPGSVWGVATPSSRILRTKRHPVRSAPTLPKRGGQKKYS